MQMPQSRQVVIFGGGIIHQNQKATLTPESTQRVDRFLEEHYKNPKRFTNRDSYVVCTGGYGLLAAGSSAPAQRKWREGRLMADRLIENGFLSRKIEIEDTSTSTLTNWTSSIAQDLINPEDFNEDKPLGIVSHPCHLNRIEDIGKKLGFHHLEKIPTHQQDDRLKELVLRTMYAVTLFGSHDIEALEKRESQLLGTLAKVMHGTSGR